MFAKLKYRALHNRLRQVNRIPNINAGGCAVTAYYAYEFAKQRYPQTNPQICFLIEFGYANEVENAKRNHPTSCSHAVLRIGNLFYDSTKVYTTEELQNKWEHDLVYMIDPELAYESIQKSFFWNPKFDRKHIPQIQQILRDAS